MPVSITSINQPIGDPVPLALASLTTHTIIAMFSTKIPTITNKQVPDKPRQAKAPAVSSFLVGACLTAGLGNERDSCVF